MWIAKGNGFGLIHHGIHKPMITNDEFEELQIIVTGRTVKKRNRHYNPEFPGQKLLSCGKCGSIKRTTGSISSNGHGGKIPRYYCMACKKYWNRDKVHLAVEDYLSRVSLTSEAKTQLRDALVLVWRKKNNDRQHLISALNTKIIDLKKQKSNLVLSYSTANNAMKLDIEIEIESLREEIDNCN